ncbi:DODA-type extradiol aromatic ring-opening family dioxygenase [Paenibacillus gansuensis]|uniref:DODA-type extradiol aromatic ring-opening family dioxygenase n=1 Tax=Paenibacillus gansuensis TaxID=306542 RepID=A0ABW5PG06_9BACL
MISPLFIAHGSPMMAIDDNECALFLQEYGRTLKPKAIVLFSAHWETEVTAISSSDEVYETIYDFGGFPKELFEVVYPARGSSEVASVVAERFEAAGIDYVKNTNRGLDHGSWVVLSRLFPDADIPVVQLSVNPYAPAEQQYRIGEALRGLCEQDILVIGSGATVHNLRILNWGSTAVEPWAVAFDDWIVDRMQKRQLDDLFHYEERAPEARRAVPRAEHFVPILIAFGSGDPDHEPEVIHRSYEFGSLSYLCMKF